MSMNQASLSEQMPSPEISLQLMRALLVPEAADAMKLSLNGQFPDLLKYSDLVAPVDTSRSQQAPIAPVAEVIAQVAPTPAPVAAVASQASEVQVAPSAEIIHMNQPSGEINIKAPRDLNNMTQAERIEMATIAAAAAHDEFAAQHAETAIILDCQDKNELYA